MHAVLDFVMWFLIGGFAVCVMGSVGYSLSGLLGRTLFYCLIPELAFVETKSF